ncbi:MAG: hypothetical protein A3C47_01610 [Omnitrophica bacterium RIFCSPHIGHO2_02_FULL_51_18]|nr:MAG: hypothetical protein A3C47_01610 [Omnitrophica bacterium RIFCSPHIGHO2_02_FULL_51_18]
MLKEQYKFFRNFLFVGDLLIATANFFLIYYLPFYFRAFYKMDLFPESKIISAPHGIDLYFRVYYLVLLLWSVLLAWKGEYHHLRIQTYRKIIINHLINGAVFFCLFAGFAFLFKLDFLSRKFMVIYTVSTTLWLLSARLTVLSIAYYVRKRGYNYRNLLVVGTGRRAQEFLSLAARHKEWGYRVIGLVDRDPGIIGKKIAGYEVLGVLDDLPKLLETNIVDEMVLVVPRGWLKEIEKCILYCEAVGIPATLSTDFFDLEIAYGVPKELDGFTYLTFETRRLKDSELLIKRFFDILFSLTLLLLSLPVLAGVCVLVKIASKGPVFFKQKRCGLNGREFMLYKFRSMVVGAEAKLGELKALNEMSGPVFKLENDPRLTKIGKFLRRTSLDEFPQLWNVLKGDMSLVGPRPPLPSEVKKYEPWQRRRLSMKPGITCIWQVSGRNKINFEDWMRMDLYYIDRWSLWLDMKITLLTVRAVLTAHGAK